MTKHIASKIWSLRVAAVAIAFATTAQADDRKAFTGFSCVETQETVNHLLYTYFGSALNNSSASRNFQCTATRDNTADTMDITDWDVTVRRNAATLVWDVRFWSVSRNGNDGFFSTVTVPGGTGYQDLDGAAVTSGFLDGNLVLESDVPAGAEIASYAYQETSPTD
jgi:hypothetical protein